MSIKLIVGRVVILIGYIFFLSFFLLMYQHPVGVFTPNNYTLKKSIKIDTINKISRSTRRGGSGYYYSIIFKDGDKKYNLILHENTKLQNKIRNKIIAQGFRTIDLIKRQNCEWVNLCMEKYFTYDERFVCDENGKCDFTDTYKKEQLGYLIFGALIFIVITYCTYRVYNSRIIKSLKGEKFQFKFLDSFKD